MLSSDTWRATAAFRPPLNPNSSLAGPNDLADFDTDTMIQIFPSTHSCVLFVQAQHQVICIKSVLTTSFRAGKPGKF